MPRASRTFFWHDLNSGRLTFLFETSVYSLSTSSRRVPHHLRIISLLVSLQTSLLPPRGSSTSSFAGASHLQSVSKLTHTRVSSRLLRLHSSLVWDPLFTHPATSYYSLLTWCLFSLRLRELFPRVLIALIIDIWTLNLYGHWNTDLFSLDLWVLYCTRLHIYHTDLCIVFIMSHVFSGMLTHLCLVTCPTVRL